MKKPDDDLLRHHEMAARKFGRESEPADETRIYHDEEPPEAQRSRCATCAGRGYYERGRSVVTCHVCKGERR